MDVPSALVSRALLPAVAETFNRHHARQLIVSDPQLANLLIDGVFSSADPSPLLRCLRTQPDLNVDESGSDIRITKKIGSHFRRAPALPEMEHQQYGLTPHGLRPRCGS